MSSQDDSKAFDPFEPSKPRSVSVTMPGLMAYYFDSYCLKMQLRRSDVVKEAIEDYLEKKGIPRAVYKA